MSCMQSHITVKPIWINDITGEKSYFYDEMGTPAFYMIKNILQKHLGENIWVSLDNTNTDLFTIYDINKPIEIIKKIIDEIYELHTLIIIYEEHMPSSHIKFEIINIM